MLIAVGLQTLAVLIGILIAALVGGSHAAWSLFLGGAAGVVPNALFAFRLSRHKGRSPESYPTVFFLGEFTKIGLTIFAFGLILKYAPDTNWLAAMIGFIVGLKAQLFALWFGGDRTDKVVQEAIAAKKQADALAVQDVEAKAEVEAKAAKKASTEAQNKNNSAESSI
jgi:ATP synthase protein I